MKASAITSRRTVIPDHTRDEAHRVSFMSFIRKQVGHTTTRMIVDHSYRRVPAPDDGDRLEEAWNSTTLLPPSEDEYFQVS
jgi:hypothetical protein